jgi:molybdate transport system regulatory protein
MWIKPPQTGILKPTESEDRSQISKGIIMRYGARNQVKAKVTSIRSDQVMSLVKFDVVLPASMASVLTAESVADLELKVGDEVQLVIKAIHVLPVKD